MYEGVIANHNERIRRKAELRELLEPAKEAARHEHRTYAEIVDELISKPSLKAAYPVVEWNKNEAVILSDKVGTRKLQIWYQGEVDFFGVHALSYGELGAIYAACAELAELYNLNVNDLGTKRLSQADRNVH